jgi:S-disulfanyl-L-cysteine oxidoreductase SoxD
VHFGRHSGIFAAVHNLSAFSVSSAANRFVVMAWVLFLWFVVTSVLSAQEPRTTWDAVYSAEQARRGAALFKAHCAACHGEALGGIESAPALTGDTFNSTWEGVPLEDLFERARTTMPQNAPGSLSRQQNADILAYILDVGKFPAGDKPLDPTALAGITYRTYKP